MRTPIILICLLAGSFASYAQTTLAGKWHGAENNLPVVDLTVEQNGTQASGSAIFYLLKRNSDGGKPYIDGQANVPMEDVKYGPERMSFDVHRRDGSVVNFRLELVDIDHARLLRLSQDDGPAGSVFPVVRVRP
jgi:hypothetical protein